MALIDSIKDDRISLARALATRAGRGAGVMSGRWARTLALVAAAMLAAGLVAAGCSAVPGVRYPSLADGPGGYWTRQRLLGAVPWTRGYRGSPGGAKNAHTAGLAALRVGALFTGGAGGDHFCTASVVASPGKDLLVTAAHCLSSGNGTGYRRDIVFIPDYRDGQAPAGIWTPRRLLVAPLWLSKADPGLDVGFVILDSRDGRNIQQILGANQLAVDAGYRYLVRVTGYPDSANAPITCRNWTTEQSATQLRFDCGGFTGGTSGSPWVTHFNPQSRDGTIVGVIGGYQQGGDTAAISYSSYLGTAVHHLYSQAIADETTPS
jgi:V8-like Glu-specific endopeptidase